MKGESAYETTFTMIALFNRNSTVPKPIPPKAVIKNYATSKLPLT